MESVRCRADVHYRCALHGILIVKPPLFFPLVTFHSPNSQGLKVLAKICCSGRPNILHLLTRLGYMETQVQGEYKQSRVNLVPMLDKQFYMDSGWAHGLHTLLA